MGGMSSHVMWKQTLTADAEATLAKALAARRCTAYELSSQQWEARSATIGGIRDYMTSFLAPAAAAWSSLRLHLNSLIGEPVATELSRLTGGAAIVFLEYDEAAWGYSLFSGGERLDRFWSVPAVAEMSPQECAGNAATVSAVFGVPAQSVAPYLRHLAEEDYESKAFADDEFPLGDHWVRVDFMRRLGLTYPSPGGIAGGRYIRITEP